MPFFRGLGMSASLIVALGPQNAYLIKHGLLRRSAVFGIAAIYVLIDAALIALGAMGAGSLIASIPILKMVFSAVAAAFFLFYGLASIHRAFGKEANAIDDMDEKAGYGMAIILSLANPGVLFDTIVIAGGLAGHYQEFSARVLFSMGAATASLIWFSTLSMLSFWAGGFVKGPSVWKVLDFVIGVLMVFLAFVVLQDIVTPRPNTA